MALKAIFRAFGWKKQKEEKKEAPARNHPYDEVTDDQLENNRASASPKPPRSHPYDEVSDADLEENRNKKASKGAPARRHNYDEVDLDRTMSKMNKPKVVEGKKKLNKKPSAGDPDLNYVEVDIQPRSGASGSDAVKPIVREQPVIYSEVRASTAEDLKRNSPPRE